MTRHDSPRTSGVPDARAARRLRLRLLAWYRRARRALPWRNTRDPYRIWVSEVMLQQTQVATVLPYYQSFVRRFPNVKSLAVARPDDVLAAWSGLGYYRRARHLHAAARAVVRDHAGRVPGEELAFGRLPGVGRYTRGAVLSIAFDRPLPALDGNVARVLARVFAVPWTVRDSAGARRLWRLATLLVPMRGAGDWNQALMELGATICTPRAPRCSECPISENCEAFDRGVVDRIPRAAPRGPVRRVRRAVAVLRRGPRWVLIRRSGELLDGLWEPPGVELDGARREVDDSRRSVRTRLGAEIARHGLSAELAPTPHRVRHRITDRAIEVEVWEGVVPRVPRRAHVTAVDPREPGVAITGLTRRLVRMLGE